MKDKTIELIKETLIKETEINDSTVNSVLEFLKPMQRLETFHPNDLIPSLNITTETAFLMFKALERKGILYPRFEIVCPICGNVMQTSDTLFGGIEKKQKCVHCKAIKHPCIEVVYDVMSD